MSNNVQKIGGFMEFEPISAPPLAPSGRARQYYDTGSNTIKISSNGGAYADISAGGAVTSITGAANQVTASASTGAVTLSLPSALTLTGTSSISTSTGNLTLTPAGAFTVNAATSGITFQTFGTNRWIVNGADGMLIAGADNTYDIGLAASGSIVSRPRNLFLSNSLNINSGSFTNITYDGTGVTGASSIGGFNGITVDITGGAGGPTGAGANVTMTAGAGGSTSGNAGDSRVRGGGTTSGTSGSVIFSTCADNSTTQVNRWKIPSTGHLLAVADNTYDIGASGATRPRTGYYGTSLVIAGTTTLDGTSVVGSGTMSVQATSATLDLVATSTNNVQLKSNAIKRFTVNGVAKALTSGSPVNLFEIALPASTMAGGTLLWTVRATDGADFHVNSGVLEFAAVNKAGTYTTQATSGTGSTALAVSNGGSLTTSFDFLNGTNKVTLRVTSTTTLTASTFDMTYQIVNNSTQDITVV